MEKKEQQLDNLTAEAENYIIRLGETDISVSQKNLIETKLKKSEYKNKKDYRKIKIKLWRTTEKSRRIYGRKSRRSM